MRELLQYMQTHDPVFCSGAQGATDEEIARFESLLKRPLPSNYKDFLGCMGRNMGSLRAEDTDFSVAERAG